MKYFAKEGESQFIAFEHEHYFEDDMLEMSGPNPGGAIASKSIDDEFKGVWILKPKTKEELEKIIDEETSKLILEGFFFTLNLGKKDKTTGLIEVLEEEKKGTLTEVFFKYGNNEQINFSDSANYANSQINGVIDKEAIEFRGYSKNEAIDLSFSAKLFLKLYFEGALLHKQLLLKEGRKKKLEAQYEHSN